MHAQNSPPSLVYANYSQHSAAFMSEIPTGKRLTSLLLTKHRGVEFRTTEPRIQWQGGGFESGTSGLQDQQPNHEATLPPLWMLSYVFVITEKYVLY